MARRALCFLDMMQNMANEWVVSVDRDGFGWKYAASYLGVVHVQGWFRSDGSEDDALQLAWRIGKLALDPAVTP